MTHLQERLSDRINKAGIQIDESALYIIARACHRDSAVLLGKLDSLVNDSDLAYNDRQESNGDLIVLIVRNRLPHTVMFRRSNQSNNPNQLGVYQLLKICNDRLTEWIQ